MIGRAAKLERLGLAEQVAPGCWTLKPGIEGTLRDLSIRGDIIKTMHRAVTGAGRKSDLTGSPCMATGLRSRCRVALWLGSFTMNCEALPMRSLMVSMDGRRGYRELRLVAKLPRQPCARSL